MMVEVIIVEVTVGNDGGDEGMTKVVAEVVVIIGGDGGSGGR